MCLSMRCRNRQGPREGSRKPGISPMGSRGPSTACFTRLHEKEDPETGALNEKQDWQEREGRSEGLLRIRQEHPWGLGTNSNRPQIQCCMTEWHAESSPLGSTQMDTKIIYPSCIIYYLTVENPRPASRLVLADSRRLLGSTPAQLRVCYHL